MNDKAITLTHGAITKEEAVAVLSGIRAAFIYGFIIDHDISQEALPAKIRGKQFGFENADGERTAVSLTELADMLADRDHRRIIRDNYHLVLRIELVRSTHELLMLYCEETKQLPKYQAKPWYQFARIVRNLYSHKDGALLHRWPSDLAKAGVTSVTWRKRTISAGDVGKIVGLSPFEAFKLHGDMADVLRHELD